MESWQSPLKLRGFISLSKTIWLLRGTKIICSLAHTVILQCEHVQNMQLQYLL